MPQSEQDKSTFFADLDHIGTHVTELMRAADLRHDQEAVSVLFRMKADVQRLQRKLVAK